MKTTERPFITPITESMEEIFESKENYQLIKIYFKIMFSKLSQAEKLEQLEKKFTPYENDIINMLLDRLDKYDIRAKFVDREFVLYSPTKSEVKMMMEKKYPLKCDICNCPKGQCNGYTKEEIKQLKELARLEVPISKWPENLFDKPVPF